jgi:hypothetical protein
VQGMTERGRREHHLITGQHSPGSAAVALLQVLGERRDAVVKVDRRTDPPQHQQRKGCVPLEEACRGVSILNCLTSTGVT